MDESDSYDNVVALLDSLGIASDDPSTACADILESIVLSIINSALTTQAVQETEVDLRLIDDIRKNKVATSPDKYAGSEGCDSGLANILMNYVWHTVMPMEWILF